MSKLSVLFFLSFLDYEMVEENEKKDKKRSSSMVAAGYYKTAGRCFTA
jgi:hypothetical protein